MPNGYLDKSKKSECLYFIIKSKKIVQKCSDDYNLAFFSSIVIEEFYDSIQIINGKPYDRYILFEKNTTIETPYSLSSVIFNEQKKYSITLKTNQNSSSYSITINKLNWLKETIPFTYYYRK